MQTAGYEMPSPSRQRRRLGPWIIAALLLHLLPFATRPALIGGDEPHYALMAHSIAVDGDLDLRDDYAEVRRGSNAAGVKRSGQALEAHLRDYRGERVFAHPIGLPVLAAPIVWVLHAVAPGTAPDIPLGLFGLTVTFAGLIGGWWLLRRLLDDEHLATVTTFAIYFGTPLWFYSRTFFTEPYIWSFAILAVVAIVRRSFITASILLGVIFLLKEVALLIIVPILMFVAIRSSPRRSLLLAIGPAVAVAMFVGKNLIVYGSPLVTFQDFQSGSFLHGAIGTLIDPQHGLLPFAPVLLVALFGWTRLTKTGIGDTILPYAGLIAISYFVLTASWIDWRGGACYGPRLLVPIIPLFAIPLARVLCSPRTSPYLRRLTRLTVIVGFALQFCAATDPFHAMWSPSIRDLVGGNPSMAVGGAGMATLILYLVDRQFSTETLP